VKQISIIAIVKTFLAGFSRLERYDDDNLYEVI